MPTQFDHEKLRVYAVSLEFISWATTLITEIPAKASVKDQLDRASTSVPLNIAEGNVKWTPADRAKFFRIAAGSAAECAACLDVLVSKGFCASERVAPGKEILLSIVSMLISLAHTFEGRIREDDPEYGRANEEEEEK